MNSIDNHLQFLCALRSFSSTHFSVRFTVCSRLYFRVLAPILICCIMQCIQNASLGMPILFSSEHQTPNRGRESEREHILHNIQDSGIPWLPSHPDWNSPPSSLCIRLFEFFKPPKNKATQEQAVRPQMEQIALLWKQTQAEYLNEK